MSWNYRFIRKMDGEDSVFHVHEVYYDKKGKAESWSKEPMYPSGATPIELMEDILLMSKAFQAPVMEEMSDASGENEALVEVEVSKVTGKNRY